MVAAAVRGVGSSSEGDPVGGPHTGGAVRTGGVKDGSKVCGLRERTHRWGIARLPVGKGQGGICHVIRVNVRDSDRGGQVTRRDAVMCTEERKHVRFDFSRSEEEDGKEREDPAASALCTLS